MTPTDPAPSEHEELLHRIADGEVNEADVPGDLDAVSLEEIKAIESLSAELRGSLPQEVEVSHPEFFNSQIRRFIERDEASERSAASEAAAEPSSGFFRWFPWAAAAAACLLAAFLGTRGGIPGNGTTQVASAYAPASTVQVKTWYSEEADATVIDLVGLDEIPADREITGQQVASYQLDNSTVAHRLTTPDGGEVVTLVAGPGEIPTFFTN